MNKAKALAKSTACYVGFVLYCRYSGLSWFESVGIPLAIATAFFVGVFVTSAVEDTKRHRGQNRELEDLALRRAVQLGVPWVKVNYYPCPFPFCYRPGLWPWARIKSIELKEKRE